MEVLLDTCTLLWLADDQSRLSAAAIDLIRRSAGQLYVSAISAMEIAIKVHARRLELVRPPQAWFDQAVAQHGVQELPVTSPIATASISLPPIHKDPVDRLIIATAKLRGLRIITPDHHIHCYPEIKAIW